MLSQQLEAAVPADALDSEKSILERRKVGKDDKHRQKVYQLRRVAANMLDITSAGSYTQPKKGEGNFADEENDTFEEARHNPVSSNIDIQAQSLSFSAPDVSWKAVRPGTSFTRRAWYLEMYKRQNYGEMYQWALLDLIIGGEGNIFGGVRDGEPFLEWADDLDVQWDTAFKEWHKKRFVYYTKHLPAAEAVRHYPELAKKLRVTEENAGEKIVDVTCYWSKTTEAVLYKDEFIVKPKPNEYGRIPGIQGRLFLKPGQKYATGSVENQMGTLQLILRLQRAQREVALRAGSPVGEVRGPVAEGNIEQIESGEEAVILRFATADGEFNWKDGANMPEVLEKAYDRAISQTLPAESGVDPFMLSQTDVDVDFASQLSFMAGRSGVRGKHTALRFEEMVKDSINLLMDIGAKFAPPMKLYVQDTEIDFAEMMPMADGRNALAGLLGSDGEILFKPGSMEFKSPAQKLQEVGVFGSVLQTAQALPPALQPQFISLAAEAFEVDNPDDWAAAVQESILQQQMMQQQATLMGAQPNPQQNGPSQNGAAPRANVAQQGAA